MRIFRTRTLKFKPRITTSFRPRGKWGDLIVCLLPVSWCVNILINSNFLLKLIEWQNESSLFTIRIRGKQWYWIYKFDLKNITDIISAPKNLGRNKWGVFFGGDLQLSDDYLHILQLRSQNKWIKKYWVDMFTKNSKIKKFNLASSYEHLLIDRVPDFFFDKNKQQFLNFSENFFINKQSNKNPFLFESEALDLPYFILFDFKTKKNSDLQLFDILFLNRKSNSFSYYFDYSEKKNLRRKMFFYNVLSDNKDFSKYCNQLNFSDFNEITRFYKKRQGTSLPTQLVKYPVNNLDLSDFILLKIKFNDGQSVVNHKIIPHTIFLTIKQKKYKRRKKINDFTVYYKDDFGKKTKNIRYSGKLFLKDNSYFTSDIVDPSQYYNMLKKNKKRGENIPIVYSKRMLRTQRTLVLPAHVNITAITNSYDVVHSWFIPGLGIKLDCIPGRATHHTFFVDSVGFYYGQCAEICGRYHHHMPIRICALPFEHFLVWWHSFGLPKLLFTNTQKRFEINYSFRKYVW